MADQWKNKAASDRHPQKNKGRLARGTPYRPRTFCLQIQDLYETSASQIASEMPSIGLSSGFYTLFQLLAKMYFGAGGMSRRFDLAHNQILDK